MKKIEIEKQKEPVEPESTELIHDDVCSCGKEICDGTCANCTHKDTDDDPDAPMITHVVVLKSEIVLYCYRTMELLRNLPNGEITTILVCDVLDYPTDGDRGIITVEMDNVDYIHEWYHEDAWNQLVEMVMQNHIEEDDDENPLLYG